MRSADDGSGFWQSGGNPRPVKFSPDTGSGGLTDGKRKPNNLTESLDTLETELQQYLGVEVSQDVQRGCFKVRKRKPSIASGSDRVLN
ncbi:uncharacterized protein [Scyliorhinus torazame]|uniref:uncharacterized protein isoform X2 n=1 Tax=Scyliorhinus torazame TaxID=75743 RepID=UPI003B5B9540